MNCSDVEWDLILNGLGLRGKRGNITVLLKAEQCLDMIGKDSAQFSTFDFKREVMDKRTKQKEWKTFKGYFVLLGALRSKYSQKVRYQFKDLKLEDGPEPGIYTKNVERRKI
jgi:hypothetical protein